MNFIGKHDGKVIVEISASELADFLDIVKKADQLDHAIHLLENDQIVEIEALLKDAQTQKQSEISFNARTYYNMGELLFAAVPDVEKLEFSEERIDYLSDAYHKIFDKLSHEDFKTADQKRA